ncbi:MAG: D-alanyl-D-alanine carboxypeptidase [Firmicutes bacterium]|nr:D-alanyl-D-alanine carboxypeptidase [Bacillota bacterium]MDD4263823.1 D-alanyl-D-alanine carboxypeptidase [Bacillota bacterium]MDD4694119.1 D-alanyl-D-alanine carboxypeptidase [Bacillota bacterium]
MKQIRFVVIIVILVLMILVIEPPLKQEILMTVSQLNQISDISSLFRNQPSIGASAAILFDPASQTILYSKKADIQRAPASTTKIMTAILAIERCSLDEVVTISHRAATINGSQVGLREGEVYTVEKLLWSLLLQSGNDAAISLAEHIAGSVEDFAKYMNARARELGCKHTNFVNPHGLSDPNHYSTVHDLALMASHALRYPLFQEIVSSKEKEIPWQKSFDKYLKNTNKLLWIMQGADGVKTGTTNLAGACLVSSATRDSRQVIAVVLNSSNRWVESARLLEWGFTNTECLKVIEKNETIPDIYAQKSQRYVVGYVKGDVYVSVPKGVKPYMHFAPYQLVAPIAKDQLLGFLEVGPVADFASVRRQPVYALTKVGQKRSFLGIGF